MVVMEKERDWFRDEALKLNTISKQQEKELNRIKVELAKVSEDKEFYQA